jgi:hypothetical protein
MIEGRWSVLTVQDRQTVDPGVGIRQIRQVRFRTADGYLGMVELPVEDASPQAVQEAIQAEVKNIEAIFKLKG